MVNILLEGFDIDAPWLMDELKRHILPRHRAVIVALSFRDDRLRCAADWDALYGRGCGRYYDGIVKSLMAYGLSEDSISFINYFTDTHESAVRKIEQADIVYFTGGLPDRMLERIDEMGLRGALMGPHSVIMGYSAGAVIQLREYHLSPDDDYPEFSYYPGLGYLDGFYHEVHYVGAPEQDEAIRRVLAERGAPVYATAEGAGAIVVEDGEVRLIGDVREHR